MPAFADREGDGVREGEAGEAATAQITNEQQCSEARRMKEARANGRVEKLRRNLTEGGALG
jgi:hypothetical protein